MENELEIDYKLSYEKERLKRMQLEDECDLLSLENIRLQSELAELKSKQSSETPALTNISEFNSNGTVESYSDLLLDGDQIYTKTCEAVIRDACDGKNVISLHFCNYNEFILCAGSNNGLYLYSTSGQLQWTQIFSSPAISIHSFKNYTCCSLLDGSTLLMTFCSNTPKIEQLKHHTKQNICVRWSSNGQYIATASADKTVNLYKTNFSNDDSIVEKIATFRYESIPESIAFAPCMTSSSNNTTSVLLSDIIISSEVNAYDLIVGLRDDTNLRYINCQNTSVQKLVSLNERDWDTHCSFTPLQMSLSPNNKYLLVATDKNYHILYALRTNKRVRIFSDHTCNEYGKPKISWDKTGKYIYSNTEFEHTIYVYSVVTERVVYKLNGHTGSVRDLAYRETDRMLISCSFDKTVRIWRNEEM